MNNDILDLTEEKSTDSSILATVRWWERMRILYNIIIVGIIITSFFFVHYGFDFSSIRFQERLFVMGIYLVIANLFYCLGWGLDILFRHYFKIGGFNKAINITFFTVGTLLIALFTLFFSFVLRW